MLVPIFILQTLPLQQLLSVLAKEAQTKKLGRIWYPSAWCAIVPRSWATPSDFKLSKRRLIYSLDKPGKISFPAEIFIIRVHTSIYNFLDNQPFRNCLTVAMLNYQEIKNQIKNCRSCLRIYALSCLFQIGNKNHMKDIFLHQSQRCNCRDQCKDV